MRRMRGVGCTAAVVAVVVLAGCGTEDDPAGATESSTSASAVESVEAEVVPSETVPEYPPGPSGDIDRRADEEGWVVDSLYATAAEFVDDICVSLPDEGAGGSRAQWLVEGGYLDGDGAAVLSFGVPRMCSKWAATVRQAVSGDYERWIKAGEYEVVADPAPYDPESDVQQIAPGAYEARGEFSDCYWERTSQGGDIIDNQFVTQARVLSVTLRAGELFKNDCGPFRPVG